MDIIEQGVISKAAAAKLRREVGTHLSEIKHAVTFALIESKDRAEFDGRAAELERLADTLSDRTNSDDPLLA